MLNIVITSVSDRISLEEKDGWWPSEQTYPLDKQE